MRPATETRPLVASSVPAMIRNSVLLPAPLRPIIPTTEPFGTSNDMSRSASNSECLRRPLTASLSMSLGWCQTR